MWEKNFWKIYSVSRCSSDIEHKPIIPKQQASSKFLFCPTKYVKKQVLFIDLGFFYQSIGDFAESDKNKKSMIEFSSYACNMIFYANIHSIYDEKEYLVLLFFLNICKEFTSIKIKVR